MFRRSGRKGNYAYAVARVKAKKAKLLTEEDYDKLLQMAVPEISRYISEIGYQKEMVDYAGKYSGLDLLEHALNANLARVLHGVLSSTEGELNTMVSAYLEKWDFWNLKMILRGKSYGLSADEIRDHLIIAGSLSAESLDKLLALDLGDDLMLAFAKMSGISSQDVLASYKDVDNKIGSIEDFLDKYYYYRLLASVDPSNTPGKMFRDYIRREIDAKNLETILKLKAEGIYGEPVMKYIIPGGKEVDLKLATQLANAETIPSISSDVQQLEFYEFLKPLVENEGVLIRDVVREMQKYEIAQAKKFAHMYPLSVVPVVDFVIHKEFEVSNIRTVARGLESGLDKDKIKELLVI